MVFGFGVVAGSGGRWHVCERVEGALCFTLCGDLGSEFSVVPS